MRVLVVEDELQIARNIRAYLEENSFAVDVANDGENAVYLGKINSYDAIVLDIMLPKKDGFAVCRELRDAGITTPVLMLTARDSLEDRIAGLDIGADDYLIKPFSLRELFARINALIRRKYNNLESGTILCVGDLSLDTKTKKVIRENNEILLSKKLFQLLEFLMRNTDRVVSKAEIEEHIWNNEKQLWSDVVRSQIQLLREKIDRNYELKLIKTVHGMGYTINNSLDNTN